MSATLLAQRLRKLEEIGVVERRRATGSAAEYHLTARRRGAAADRRGARPLGRALDRQPAEARPARRRLPDVGHPALRAARRSSRATGASWSTSASRRAPRRAALVAGRRGRRRRPVPRRPGPRADVVVESTVRALTEVWTGDSDAAEAVAERPVRVRGAARDAKRALALARPQRLRPDARSMPHAAAAEPIAGPAAAAGLDAPTRFPSHPAPRDRARRRLLRASSSPSGRR